MSDTPIPNLSALTEQEQKDYLFALSYRGGAPLTEEKAMNAFVERMNEKIRAAQRPAPSVWILTVDRDPGYGPHSTQIIGVHPTKEAAEQMQAEMEAHPEYTPGYDEFRVEEYPLGELSSPYRIEKP